MIQWGLGLLSAGLVILLRGAAEKQYTLENIVEHDRLFKTGLALSEYLFDFSRIFILCGMVAILAGVLIKLIFRKEKHSHCEKI